MAMKRVRISERQGMITIERAKELLSYSPETGEVRWIARSSPRCPKSMIGTIAGSANQSNGHRVIIIDGHPYYAQQVAWFLYHGSWPRSRLRFLDGNFLNHAIDNMSDATVNNLDTEEGRRSYNREKDLIRTFGITPDEYDDILKAQGSVCVICLRPEKETRNGRVKMLAVDHNHTTGETRGLLCAACNKGIGWLNEDVASLRRAVSYLEYHNRHTGEIPGVSPALHRDLPLTTLPS